MITPKPKTVVELFEGHPERWNKGCIARDKDGLTRGAHEPEAICWCLFGAAIYIHCQNATDNYTDEHHPAMQLQKHFSASCPVGRWNDAPERTFEEILAKAKELGI